MAILIEDIYEQHIKPLPITEQLRLVELIARETAKSNATAITGKHDIMELHGLGAETWEGVDAQEYVGELRNEWDRNS